MIRLKKIVASLLIGALAAGFAAGCGHMPTAPAPAAQATASPSARVAESNGLLGDVISIVNGLVKLVFRILTIDGSVGGSLTNGRWNVNLPPGAISGTATISVGVADASSSSCQLDISPADKNHFSVPARLTVSCPNVSTSELQRYVIFLYNPQTKTWAPVDGSTVDLNTKTVSAPLQHFSQYSVGRAGW
jgi:hypothetical protein